MAEPLKIGTQVYDETVSLVTAAAERAAALESKAKKYPGQRVPKTRTVCSASRGR